MAVSLQVESLVHFRVAERRLILPDTSLDLAWVDERIDMIGPMSTARLTRYPIGKRVVLLSLNPLIGSRWLGVPLHLLTNRVVDLFDINPALAKQLGEHFSGDTVRSLVRSNKDGNFRPSTRGEIAAAYLERGESVGKVAVIVNLSERQLTRCFQMTTGLHPKRY
jgi:AraC-like DNA-binding protein